MVPLGSSMCHSARDVGLAGVEPATSPLSGVRSNQLSYSPREAITLPVLEGARHLRIAIPDEVIGDGDGVDGP